MAETNLEKVMREIDDLGVGSADWHEAMWFLYSILARRHAGLAWATRLDEQRRARAAATRAARAQDTPP